MISINAKCPHCGKDNKIQTTLNNAKYRNTLLCDPDIGGCERLFFYEITVSYSVETYEIKGYNKEEA